MLTPLLQRIISTFRARITLLAPTATGGTDIQMKSLMKVIFYLVFVYIGAVLSYQYTKTGTFSGKGFSREEVQKIKDEMKKEIESSGKKKVLKVAMAKVAPQRLEGFVKIKLVSGSRYALDCEAIKGENLHIIWKCNSSD